jgi:hypothetical protein
MNEPDLDFIRRILSVAECGKPDLNRTVYRANCYLIEASKGNWDLQTAVVMHGTSVGRIV